jgi:glycosyltransferase involved in cell wall biosynthesis
MLCASAYAYSDFKLTGTYINRCFKWGYFPQTYTYDINELINNKIHSSILWVGRFIEWKHPEIPVLVAKRLKETGKLFSMNIIGSGTMENEIKEMIDNYELQDCVHLLGSMKPQEVREHMKTASIFIATSNFMEGWGAIVNEAMNSGCAVIVSHAMGSVPFLIENGKDGILYKSGNTEQLYQHINDLLDNPDKVTLLGKNAYNKIISVWNARNAAKQIIDLIESLLVENKNLDVLNNGPCSKAELVKNNWFGELMK